MGQRQDGYNDGYGNTFQGVRAYDGNLGQWTTPERYGGLKHDPMSQKPYMWNKNNPLTYADPSGYTPVVHATSGNQQVAADDVALGNEIIGYLEKSADALPNTPENAAAKAFGAWLKSDASNGFIITMDEKNVGDSHGNFAVAEFDPKNLRGISFHTGTLSAIARTKGGDPQFAALQGVANDLGTVAFASGSAGTRSQQSAALSAVLKDNRSGDDKNQDKWANDNLLAPMHLCCDH